MFFRVYTVYGLYGSELCRQRFRRFMRLGGLWFRPFNVHTVWGLCSFWFRRFTRLESPWC